MTKTCSRCGVTKPLDEFRKYYGSRKSHYKYCLTCEKIEMRRRYLTKRASLTPEQQEELNNINALYAKRKAAGLETPDSPTQRPTTADIVLQQLKETP